MTTTDWQLMDGAPAPVAPSGEFNVAWQATAAGTNPRYISAHSPNMGSVDARTTVTETIGLASRGKLVTLTNSGAIAVTLDSTVPTNYLVAAQATGAGTATFTPSLGATVNGAANIALTAGQSAWFFWTGTTWWALLGAGSSGASIAGVQNEQYTYANDSGAANAYVITLSPAPGSYTAGLDVAFKAANANSGSSTLNVNGLGPKTIQKWSSGSLVNLASGDISVGQIFRVKYDGTVFQVISGSGGSSFTAGGDLSGTSTVQEVVGILSKAIDGTTPTDGQILQYSNSTGKWELVVDRPIIIASAVPGKPASSQLVAIYTAFGSMTFPANFASPTSYGTVGTNASATATYVVTKISGGTTTTVGTVVVATSGAFTFATTGGASFTLNAGDRLTITAPGSQDATMSDVSITLVGTRTATVPSVLSQGIFLWRGVYSGATAYNINDVVSYVSGGTTSSYICILGTTGNVPTNATYWNEVAGGANGTNGSTWYNGSGAPSGGLGVNGDYYLDTTGNTIYYKSSGSWSSIGVLSGATIAGVQAESYTYIADSGTANTYAATLSPALGSYVAGVDVAFKAANANTGASTLNVNSLGAKTIKKYSAGSQVDLAANDIVAGQIVRCKYDGTNFQAFLGGGSSSAPVSGQPVIQGAGTASGSDNSFAGFTVFVRMDAHALLCLPTSWKIAVGVASGANGTVGNAKILKTAAGSTTVLGSTTVQWGGSSTPTLTAATISLSDAISLTLDYTHDWWVAVFFTSATNPNLSKFATCAGANNGYISGDHTGDSTIPSTTQDANIMLAYAVVT